MGRPLRKDVFGTDAIRTGADSNTGIRVDGYFGGSLATDYCIIKQRGAMTYVVARVLAITGDTTNGSNEILNASSTTGMEAGDAISGTGIPAGTFIGSISGSTITISQNATATNVGAALTYEGTKQVGRLVDTTPNANGEIRIVGYVGGNANNNLVPIAKLTRRFAYGFPSSPVLSTPGTGNFWTGEDSAATTNHDQTVYTWYIENDSSADIIVLTPV